MLDWGLLGGGVRDDRGMIFQVEITFLIVIFLSFCPKELSYWERRPQYTYTHSHTMSHIVKIFLI